MTNRAEALQAQIEKLEADLKKFRSKHRLFDDKDRYTTEGFDLANQFDAAIRGILQRAVSEGCSVHETAAIAHQCVVDACASS